MERNKNKILLEQTIAGIENRQREFGGKILPEGTPDALKRALGAPIEMTRRWFGLEKSSDFSVNTLRARLTGIIIEDAYYEMKALLAFWLLFIGIIYYFTEPIGILLEGRRDVKNRKEIADQATEAHATLFENDLKQREAVENLRREYLGLMQTVVELNIKYLNGNIDPEAFKRDLVALNQRLIATLSALEKAQN